MEVPGRYENGGIRRRAQVDDEALPSSSLHPNESLNGACSDTYYDNRDLLESPKVHKWSSIQKIDWVLGSYIPQHVKAIYTKLGAWLQWSLGQGTIASTLRKDRKKERAWGLVVLLLLGPAVYLFSTRNKSTLRTGPLHNYYHHQYYFEISLPKASLSSQLKFYHPKGTIADADIDHGRLDITSLTDGIFQRVIHENDYARAESQRADELAEDTSHTIPYLYWYDEDLESLHFSCRRPAWVKDQYLNCNSFHEVSFDRDYQDGGIANETSCQDYDNYLTKHGFYRDVWVSTKPSDGSTTIFKTTRYNFDFGWRNLFDVHREALIMERLTAFPNIVTSYGHCGTSVATEAVPHEVESYIVPGTGYKKRADLHDEYDVQPQNTLTAKEKLETALEMAESIAALHGFADGAIVHDDVQLQQWLRAKDGSVKLGDFNRAAILDWNVKEQDYCKYNNGAAFGNVSLDSVAYRAAFKKMLC